MFPSDRSRRLIGLMETFVSGRDRSTRHVREMEGAFAEQFDDDDRFEDLQHALAMFGADGCDDGELVKECAWALLTLRGVCVHRGCRSEVETGGRFCASHRPG